MVLGQRKSETAGQEEFQHSLELLDVITSRHLRSSVLMMVLFPGMILLLSIPSLFPQGIDSSLVVRGLLVMMWAASLAALFHLRRRIEMLRKNLIAQMDGATKTHVRAEQLYGLSIIDPLTGLYNRRFGENRLQEEIERAGEVTDPLLVLALDFDGFKGINDTYGHAAGDAALKAFSRRLQRAIRACDVPVRVGGDEFLMILPECPTDKVPDIFSRMGEVTIPVEGKQIPVRFSYGMAQCQVGDTPETLIKRADERLYESKTKRKAAAAAKQAKNSGQPSAMPSNSLVASGTAPAHVRRSPRIPKKVAVLLTGDDLGGKVFQEETGTVNLSLHGGAIVSRYKLAKEQHVILRCVETNKEAEARVVRVIESQLKRRGQEADTHTYGLAFVSSTANIWDLEFPLSGESEAEANPSLIECSRCKGREIADDGDAIAERPCERCGEVTLWERIPSSRAAREVATVSAA